MAEQREAIWVVGNRRDSVPGLSEWVEKGESVSEGGAELPSGGGIGWGKSLNEAGEKTGGAGVSAVVIEMRAGDELAPTAADGGGEAVSGVRQTSDAVETEFVGETGNQVEGFHCKTERV